jgi:hypothetical protein
MHFQHFQPISSEENISSYYSPDIVPSDDDLFEEVKENWPGDISAMDQSF